MQLHLACEPEALLEAVDVLLHRPRGPAQLAQRPDAVQDDAQVPVAHPVAEEPQVAVHELLEQPDGDELARVRPGEVLDVVVLGDDVGSPRALSRSTVPWTFSTTVRRSRSSTAYSLGRVMISVVPSGASWTKRPRLGPFATLADEIERDPGVEQRPLHHVVVVS